MTTFFDSFQEAYNFFYENRDNFCRVEEDEVWFEFDDYVRKERFVLFNIGKEFPKCVKESFLHDIRTHKYYVNERL